MDSKILSVATLFVLVVGVFAVAAENETMNRSIKNMSTTGNITVQPLSVSSVTVTPSVLDLGTVPPDGIERSYLNAVTVEVEHRGAGYLYVKASGDIISDSGTTIPINNLKFSTPDVPKTSFTKSDQSILRYIGSGTDTVLMSFYITVPLYTDPGTYSVAIIYTAT